MKATTALIFLSAISLINSYLTWFGIKECSQYFDKTEEEYQAYSKDFCNSLAKDSYKCCFLKYETSEGTYYNCAEIEYNEFLDIKTKKEYLEKQKRWKIKSLECDSSSYLYGSLLLLFVFLF